MPATFDHSDFPLEALLEAKREPISVVLPARECAASIEANVAMLLGLGGLYDQVLVLDAGSQDGTAELALAAGAEVVQEATLRPDFGPVLGKGDAMWRSLEAVRGEIVCFLDADSVDLSPEYATGLIGPLLMGSGVQFVKGAFERPFTAGDAVVPGGGGRVNELMARPLLSAFYPELAEFRQPLAGEMAARRELFEQLPFGTGYAAEIGMLIDVYNRAGIEAMAQVRVGERRQPHQPLIDLGPMAYVILRVVLERLRSEGRGPDAPPQPFHRADGRLVDVEPVERPPIASLSAAT
ncbi:MAG: glucosyl-3-phosphoglycerate synthase [Thermoleophilaceae bacterium]|nr:glucosyl-3-phosphoglycerate synthase [Thermoleophilaceae bacterium]